MPAEDLFQSDNSDETESDFDVTWFPGDGICPSTAQFSRCCQSKLIEWKHASSKHLEGFDTVQFYMNTFLSILKEVPPVFPCRPEDVNIAKGSKSFLMLRYSVQIKTTEDLDCNQPYKLIDYMQCLGSPTPAVYKLKKEIQLQAALPINTHPFCAGIFTNLVLAWSYIVSCRWVEIFQQAGWKSQLMHDSDMQIEHSFWDIVTQSRWMAFLEKPKGRFYSPWMLTSENTKIDRHKRTPVRPHSSLAFDILLEFCFSKGLEGELLTALVSVLFLTSRHAPPPKFAPPVIISTPSITSSPSHRDSRFQELFKSLDKCISLSSTQDALDSLACSVFFDASIPCNFLGAASLGIGKALSNANEIDNRYLLKAVAYKKPELSLLWAAIVRNEQLNSFVTLALKGLPPICLVAAFWTGTAQSFLQIAYHPNISEGSEEVVISRAREFQTSYFCRPAISVPWSPSPPFGVTPVNNVSLEVRAHLGHMHMPVTWRIYRVMNSGERVPASEQHQVSHAQPYWMYRPGSSDQFDDLPHAEQEVADEQSGSATSRLFNWHRSYDDGIWLDDGTGDIEFIRRRQNHPWIIDQFSESQADDPVDEFEHAKVESDSIMRWIDNVEKCRQSGEDSISELL